MSILYGKAPGWRAEGVNVDSQGRISLDLFKPWSPLLEEGENMAVLPPLPRPPAVPGFTARGGRWKRSQDGGYGMVWTYEGVEPPEGGGGSDRDEMGVEWAFNGSLYQRDIRTAPNWDKIREKYQWDEENEKFPSEYESFSNNLPRGTAMGPAAKMLNPMRGQKSYDDAAGTLTKSYYSPVIPEGAFARVNRIVTRPYRKMPVMPEERNWKYAMPDWEAVGDYFKISEHMELSGPGGWNPDVYEKVKEEAK